MLEELLINLGGKALPKLVARKLGPEMGELAGLAIEELGKAFGVGPDPVVIEGRIKDVLAQPNGQATAETAVAYAEANMSDKLLAEAERWKQANVQQAQTHELLKAQLAEGGLASSWLWVWQWVLMGLWVWAFLLVHIANALIRMLGGATVLPDLDLTVLVTLTGMYLALHMGGHTVLELMRGGVFQKAGKN